MVSPMATNGDIKMCKLAATIICALIFWLLFSPENAKKGDE